MEHHVTRQHAPRKSSSARSCGADRRTGRRGKRRFETEIDAKMALASIHASDSSSRKKTGAERRYYLCEECNGYHLTSWATPPAPRVVSIPEPIVTKKSTPAAPQIEEALAAMLDLMFSKIGSTEEYNATVAHDIQAEIDKAPSLMERIIINEVASKYLNVGAGETIAEVVKSTLKK